MTLPTKVNLSVPYLKQLDNTLNPYGSCNVTSVAMCLQYFGIKGNGNGQLEDQLYRRFQELKLSRHSPYDIEQFVNKEYNQHKIYDKFDAYAKHSALKTHLAAKSPAIVHGWFTDFGHIVVVKGYDDSAYGGRGAYIVNDPYGEYYEDGYDTSANGANQLYSYDLIRQVAGSDGDFWVHYITKKK